jgi:hypothetical protein
LESLLPHLLYLLWDQVGIEAKMMRAALIVSHPKHLLRVFGFLEVYKPVVYIFTDGSDSDGISQIPSIVKILNETGASIGKVFGRFTDKRLYDLIFQQELQVFQDLMDDIRVDLKLHHIDLLVGDSCEGFNPAHDLCRYIINAIAEKEKIANYDFPLLGLPNQCAHELKEDAIWIKLSEDDLMKKLSIIRSIYPKLMDRLNLFLSAVAEAPTAHKEQNITVSTTQPNSDFLSDFGIDHRNKASLLVECLRPVREQKKIKTWATPFPIYETYAVNKEGDHFRIISFEQHMRPIAEKILTRVYTETT